MLSYRQRNPTKRFFGNFRRSPPIQVQEKSRSTQPTAVADGAGDDSTSGSIPIATPKTTPVLKPEAASSTSAQPIDHSPDSNVYRSLVFDATPTGDSQSPNDRVLETAETACAAFKLTLKGIKEASEMFLPLKTAAAAILTVMGIVEQACQNKEDFVKINRTLLAVKVIVGNYHKPGSENLLNKRIRDLTAAIDFQTEKLIMMNARSLTTRWAMSEEDAGLVKQSFQNISVLLSVFQMDTLLDTNTGVKEALELLGKEETDKILRELTCAEKVSYNSRLPTHDEEPHGCMEGTRVGIVDELIAWAWSDESPKVYWLHGPAGAGKSTISHTFCEKLDERHMLGASFFCYRSSEKAADARLIFPTVARRLAASSPRLRLQLINALKDDSDLAKSQNMLEQFLRLIYHPMRAAIQESDRLHKVVIIEALDECINPEIVVSLIQILVSHAKDLPLKVYISSRPDPWIQEAFATPPSDVLIRRNIVDDLVLHDIENFLSTSLSELGKKRSNFGDIWPPQRQVAILTKLSNPLFIYAATALRYVGQLRGNHVDRLNEITQACLISSGSPTQKLDDLYSFIMKQAAEDMNAKEISMQNKILKAVLFLRVPLSFGSLVSLLEMKPQEVHVALSPFHSVLRVPSIPDAGGLIFPLHASFRDYLCDANQCGADHLIKPEECHILLATHCLKCMSRELQDWQTVFGLKSESAGSAVQKRPLLKIHRSNFALVYSCIHWASHLEDIHTPPNGLWNSLSDFLQKGLLDWLACLGGLGEVETAFISFYYVSAFVLRLNPQDSTSDTISAILQDTCRWLAKSGEILIEDYLEVYRSAIAWLPIQSPIRQCYSAALNLAPRVWGLDWTWEALDLIIKQEPDVYSVAFSYDNSRLVSGHSDGSIRIWSATTGKLEMELAGHSHCVKSVTFFPDSKRLVSGSEDKTLRIWNATTGRLETKLIGHSGSVTSVAVSSDCSRVVSGSCDGRARIWNATTGQLENELLQHSGSVTSVVFSRDGSQVLSGSNDKTVHIWNLTTRQSEKKLTIHSRHVYSVSISPDCSLVAWISNDEVSVHIGNTITGQLEYSISGEEYLCQRVLAFSPDSSRLVSGSSRGLVRVWNARTGQLEHNLSGHSSSVTSIAVSHDGRRVVSASGDCAMRIWDVATPQSQSQLESELTVQSRYVTTVAISRKGDRVVSGSTDGTVRIWNATTGKVENELIAHSSDVTLLVFSRDGRQLASGSKDNTVRIWNATSGKWESELVGHSEPVYSVDFSPDSRQVVTASDDRTVRIWKVTTGELENTLRPDYGVDRVTFVNEGSQVLVRGGETVVWDVMTGTLTQASTTEPDKIVTGPQSEFVMANVSQYRRWVTGACGRRLCWIAPQYRAYSCLDISGSTVCFGYPDGRVVFLDVNPNHETVI